MNVLCSTIYEEQLKEILDSIIEKNGYKMAKDFKLYLDTVIVNIPTKAKKYKQSIYSDNEDIRDVEHEDFTIPFFWDKNLDNYVILGIVKKTNG